MHFADLKTPACSEADKYEEEAENEAVEMTTDSAGNAISGMQRTLICTLQSTQQASCACHITGC